MERVKLSQMFYIEYLKLMNHYGLLDQGQKDYWKAFIKDSRVEESLDPKENVGKTFGPVNFDHFQNRNEKIARCKTKQELTNKLTFLKTYKDEDTKRDFYM
mgnify:CR=1 FL=1